jgi:hypothetical protein
MAQNTVKNIFNSRDTKLALFALETFVGKNVGKKSI